MRHSGIPSSLGLVILLFSSAPAAAQCPGCAIDFGCMVTPAFPAICPLQPQDATAGLSYAADITFWMPANFDDPGSGQNVDFEQMTITGINGLPFGLEIETSEASGIYFPQTDQFGCARICGTPLGAGTYTVNIDFIATVTVTAFGFTLDVPQTFPITLVVLPGSGGNASFTFTPTTGCGTAEVQFEALISGSGQPVSYAWDFGNGNFGSTMIPAPESYSSPGTYAVSLTTTIGGYVLNTVNLNGVNDNWCGDVEEPDIFGCIGSPDLYFVLTSGGGSQYTSSSGSDSGSESWTGLGLLLDDPPYSIQFYDEDLISPDDDLGTYNIPLAGAGSYPFTITGGTNGSLVIDLVTQITFSDSDTITVFPVPSPVLTYDTAGAEICANDTTVISWTWFNDGDTVAGVSGNCVPVDSTGLWWAVGTNGYGCSAPSDTVAVCPEVEILEGGVVLYVLGDFDSYQWGFNGVPIPGANAAVLVPDDPGMYHITVTTAYGCVLTDSIAYLATGLSGHEVAASLLIFPNPSSGTLSMVCHGIADGAAILAITDRSGRTVFQDQLAVLRGVVVRTFQLALPAGGYVVSVVNSGQRCDQSLIIAR